MRGALGEVHHFQPGVYLMAARTGQGKTKMSTALLYQAQAQRITSKMVYVDESRAEIESPILRIAFAAQSQERSTNEAESAEKRTPIPPEQTTQQLFRGYVKLFEDQVRGNTLVVIDSIWLYLSTVVSLLDVPTPPGGTSPVYGLAILALDQIAKRAEASVIAIINQDLLNVSTLEGAAEGSVGIYSANTLRIRDRANRKMRTFTLSPEAIRLAAIRLFGDQAVF
jgi:hypothetical protein